MSPRFQQQIIECLSFGLAIATFCALLFVLFHIVIWGVVIGIAAFIGQQIRFWLMKRYGRKGKHRPVIIEYDER